MGLHVLAYNMKRLIDEYYREYDLIKAMTQ